MNDLISRQAVIDAIINTASMIDDNKTLKSKYDGAAFRQNEIIEIIKYFPSAIPTQNQHIQSVEKHEKLMDEEQRIFLAAMGREREVCVKYSTVGQTNRLLKICDEIVRKVRGSLWT